MPYVDLATIHVPATGNVAPAVWGTGVRNNDEFFVDPPTCNVHNSAPVSVADNTLTILSANSERFDSDAMHSTVTFPSRITFQTAGRYELTTAVGFAGDIDGVRQIAFLFNGVTQSIRLRCGTGTSGVVIYGAYGKFTVAAGEYAEVQVTHSAGAALDTTLHEFCAKFDTR